MVSPIVTAIRYGFTSGQVLRQIAQRFPQYANFINNAAVMGYHTNQILKKIDNSGESADNAEAYLTPQEKIDKNAKKTSNRVKMGLAGAGALAAGGYLYATRNRAIRPSQITLPGRVQVPPQPPRQGPTINVTPNAPTPNRGGGGLAQRTPAQLPNQQRQLTQQAPQASRAAPVVPPSPNTPQRPPLNTPPVITPAFQHNPQKNVSLIKNINEEKRISQVVQSGLEPAAMVQVLREILPKSKIAILERAPGGFDQAILDFSDFKKNELQKTQSNTKRQDLMSKVNERKSLAQQEKERFQKQYPSTQVPLPPLIQSQEIPAEEIGMEDEIIPQTQFQPTLPITENNVQNRQNSVNPSGQQEKRVQSAAFGENQVQPLTESKALEERSFSIPHYKQAGEDEEEFENRSVMFDAINKAAKALTEGETFLGFPGRFTKGTSVAADVLRYLAGTPNIYSALLDDEEKEELSNAMIESGQLSTPGLRPASGERDMYGADMSSNMVWNLLLAVEPRLHTIERPKSVKGSATDKKGRMGSTEYRRFLTHAVYGVLSGQTISTELATKIGRISNASNSVDVIARAARQGRSDKVQEEIYRIYNNDKELFELMDFELDDFMLTEEGKRNKAEKEAFNKKADAAFMAAQTRKKNKEKKEMNEN